MNTSSSNDIIYRIDETDCISFLSSEWFTFAKNNGAIDLTPNLLIGHPFLSFIADNVTKQLLSLILERVRQSRCAVKLPFRCDSPTLRRFMEVRITPLDQRNLEFRCHTIKEEPRDWVPLIETHGSTTEELLRMCSWCKKVALPSGEWVEVEEAVRVLQLFEKQRCPQVTHGICPLCEQQVLERLRRGQIFG